MDPDSQQITTEPEKNTILVVLEGGLVTNVLAQKEAPDIQVIILDFDTEDAEEEDLILIPQGEGYKDAKATASVWDKLRAHADVTDIVLRVEQNKAA